MPLVVLGAYDPSINQYPRRVKDAANPDVRFFGAVYDPEIVAALRYFCRVYIHGHTVGGTNPSLVEALGAGCAVLASDNSYNRWVAGTSARYFTSVADCSAALGELLDHRFDISSMKAFSARRHADLFTWDTVLAKYETLLSAAASRGTMVSQRRN